MASDERMTILQSSMQDSEYDFDDDEGEYDCGPAGHPHHLSGMSLCTNNSAVYYDHDDDPEGDSIGGGSYFHLDDGSCDAISMQMSQLSMESFHHGDADGHEKFSDDERESKEISCRGVSSDSDQESLGYCYSPPATPTRLPQWRKQNKKKIAVDDEEMNDSSSEGGSADLVGRSDSAVIRTRPRGGRRPLCMDLEEVNACRDLGFDLEPDHCSTTLHSSFPSSSVAIMPTTTTTSLSISENSTLDTSSGTNSPITRWRISSPGDDPRDVKARLRVWAQAVALASTSRHCS